MAIALWPNEAKIDGRTVKMLKASVERRYKDASGSWQSSTSFSRNEIPLAIYCLTQAFGQIVSEEQKSVGVSEEVVM
jgi:hypothetical protein